VSECRDLHYDKLAPLLGSQAGMPTAAAPSWVVKTP
jgi:hypothetical protein